MPASRAALRLSTAVIELLVCVVPVACAERLGFSEAEASSLQRSADQGNTGSGYGRLRLVDESGFFYFSPPVCPRPRLVELAAAAGAYSNTAMYLSIVDREHEPTFAECCAHVQALVDDLVALGYRDRVGAAFEQALRAFPENS